MDVLRRGAGTRTGSAVNRRCASRTSFGRRMTRSWWGSAPQARARAIHAAGGEVLRAHANSDGGVDLTDLLRRLRGIGIGSLLIEGGRGIITSALAAHLVHRLT